jgi:hypothetical protein
MCFEYIFRPVTNNLLSKESPTQGMEEWRKALKFLFEIWLFWWFAYNLKFYSTTVILLTDIVQKQG